MENDDKKLLSHLTEEVVAGVKGIKLESYLVALEGWRRGLTLKWHRGERYFSLISDDKSHDFCLSRGDLITEDAVIICNQKDETKNLLKKVGITTPEGKSFYIDNQERIIDYVDKIGYPVVIKPINGKMGRAVYANIKDKEQLMTAISEARLAYDYHEYLVEKYHPGKEYRIYVVDNKVVAVTHRMPANITGDGQSSVKELINKKNSERRKNPYLRRKLIKIDSEVQNSLKKLAYNQNSILKKEERVFLRDKSNRLFAI